MTTEIFCKENLFAEGYLHERYTQNKSIKIQFPIQKAIRALTEVNL
jgi:hypothetical protein